MKHIIPHPNGKPGVEYDIVTVLHDLAAQENCDGEPYDQMVKAARYIEELRQETTEAAASYEAELGRQAERIAERDAEIEKLRQWQREAIGLLNNNPVQILIAGHWYADRDRILSEVEGDATSSDSQN